MHGVDFVLDLLALICFGLATANVPVQINLTALGLAFWVATTLI